MVDKLIEEDAEEEEGKPKKELKWMCTSNITSSGKHVNSVLDSEKMATKANIDINNTNTNEKKEEVA